MESQKVGLSVNKLLEQYGLPSTVDLLDADYGIHRGKVFTSSLLMGTGQTKSWKKLHV